MHLGFASRGRVHIHASGAGCDLRGASPRAAANPNLNPDPSSSPGPEREPDLREHLREVQLALVVQGEAQAVEVLRNKVRARVGDGVTRAPQPASPHPPPPTPLPLPNLQHALRRLPLVDAPLLVGEGRVRVRVKVKVKVELGLG